VTDLPPALAAKIEDLHRDNEAIEHEMAELAARKTANENTLTDYLEAAAICRAAWCRPDSLAEIENLEVAETSVRDVGAALDAEEHRKPRQRRDLREVVRQVLRRDGPSTVSHLSAEASNTGLRLVRESEIAKAIGRMDGELERLTDGTRELWRLAVGPAIPAGVGESDAAQTSPVAAPVVGLPQEAVPAVVKAEDEVVPVTPSAVAEPLRETDEQRRERIWSFVHRCGSKGASTQELELLHNYQPGDAGVMIAEGSLRFDATEARYYAVLGESEDAAQ
jgi:hypothetical protein